MIGRAVVAVQRVRSPTYDEPAIREALAGLAERMGWGGAASASGATDLFSSVIPAGARVVVKPNWVLHRNQGPWGLEPLVTHGAIIKGVVEGLLATGAARVSVGDAPLQECDFDRLMFEAGISEWAVALGARDARFVGPVDYRRTRSTFDRGGVRSEQEDQVPLDRFVLFDLGAESLLEPITREGHFRVTQYPPREMARTHGPGRHQFLIARDFIEADVVVNMPKLKTHKKAGLTCALKNLIGINGNKEFLPHHRVGGGAAGGDCYPGADPIKRSLEFALDRLHSTDAMPLRRLWGTGSRTLQRVLRWRGDELGVEGSWSGNDTIWRTCLDLNRILLYGRLDGTLGHSPQRRVLHIVDAHVAGHGDGPLRAEALPLGLLLASESAAAADLVGARLMGYDPALVPIISHAFDRFRWPLTDAASDAVRVTGALGEGPALNVTTATTEPIHYPRGWLDAVRSPRAPLDA
jgi:uncharacterized protein (DUF362 family)